MTLPIPNQKQLHRSSSVLPMVALLALILLVSSAPAASAFSSSSHLPNVLLPQRRTQSCRPHNTIISCSGKKSPLILSGFFGGGGGGNKQEPEQVPGGDKISKQRRAQLGISDEEDEYDLGFALEQNTDPVITKIIAGSFIVVVIALLVVGVVVPSLTDYGEGVCSPIQNAGRC